jgi:hypothetical protein
MVAVQSGDAGLIGSSATNGICEAGVAELGLTLLVESAARAV